MVFDGILNKVKDSVLGNDSNQDQQSGQNGSDPSVRPASEDPQGDPADQQPDNIRPASEDPQSDPAT